MKSISFIIPSFNSALTIEECIQSIVDLDFLIYEIIIIDDGSTDNSLTLIKNFKSKNGYVNIKIIENIINKGVSYSRNVGIDNAIYEYLSFIDADDCFVAKNFKLSQKNEVYIGNADIYICSYLQNNEKINIEWYLNTINESGMELIESYISTPVGNSVVTYVWGKFFLRSFIIENKIKFDTTLEIHEDVIFNFECLNNSKKIKLIKYEIYNYNKLSSEKYLSIKNCLDFLKILDAALSMQNNLIKFKEKFITHFICKNLIIGKENKNIKYIYKLICSYSHLYSEVDKKIIRNSFIKMMFYSKIIKLPILAAAVFYLI